MKTPFFKQQNDWFCGPACAQMFLAAGGTTLTQSALSKELHTSPWQGTARKAFGPVLRRYGYTVREKTGASVAELRRALADGWKMMVNYREVDEDISHFALVVGIDAHHIIFNDPWHGPSYRLPISEFEKRWYGRHRHTHTRWMLAIKK